jgi:predicted O-methyltransferase YrrM
MLRVLPWITDGAVDFLDGLIFDRTKKSGAVRVFEFGLGNSTLYFLSRGCQVTAVDHDEEWVNSVQQTSDAFGYSDRLKALALPRPYNSAYVPSDYDIIAIDGRDRVSCLKTVLAAGLAEKSVLLLDNTERVSEGRYAEYQGLLAHFRQIHFEHPCVPGVHPKNGNHKDKSGGRVGHRWLTTVAYGANGVQYTTMGRVF